MHTIDLAVIVIYLVAVVLVGLRMGRPGKGNANSRDYFLGSSDLPWWAVCFSVVATETSTLTVIGVPAVSYFGSFVFLQLAIGYLIGRAIVSVTLLPAYFRGEQATAYEFLGARFGSTMQRTGSIVFLITRLLADGVRLFATAIPLKVIADIAGFETTYFGIILCIGIATIVYTFFGGIRAVVWMDVIQMFVYVGGGILAAFLLIQALPGDWMSELREASKLQMIDWGSNRSLSENLTQPYYILCAIPGGAVFAMASHGTDQLIVQRLLACRSESDGKKALVLSGVVVFLQFALFLFIGALLWSFYDHASVEQLGLTRGDEIFPHYVLSEMPVGVAGLLIAGIIAAAMSTLSSSLNSLASSTVIDLFPGEGNSLTRARLATLFWGIVFIAFAGMFQDRSNPVVELGLSIASFTYGGLLGSFLLGMLSRRAGQRTAIISFLATVVIMTFVIFAVWYQTSEPMGWMISFRPDAALKKELGLRGIAWPFYTAMGVALNLLFGFVLSGIFDRAK